MSDRSIGDALVGLGFGGYLFFQGIRLWFEKQDIQNKPLSKVDSVAMGDAELQGIVKAEKTIKAPFSERDCVYCSYTVEVPDRNGWRRVDHGTVESIFYLDDGTGQILVNPSGATFYGPSTFQTVVSSSDTFLYPGLAAWIHDQQSKSLVSGLAASGRHRFTECIIEPGAKIFVEGSVGHARHAINGVEREENIVTRR
jgi:hypothetical protein